MDPSTPSAQDTPTQTPPAQPVSTVQAPPPQKTPISVSGSIEEGGVVMQESPDSDEEEVKAAPQEIKNQAASQSGGADVQEAVIEVQPGVPEVVTSSPEVEKVVEITPPDAPKLTQEIKNAGVTHSGPGVIDFYQTKLAPVKLPVTYEQAINEEELIKTNRLHNSKFWLLQEIKYIWRKINPNIALTVKKKPITNALPVTPNPAPTNQVLVKDNTKIL